MQKGFLSVLVVLGVLAAVALVAFIFLIQRPSLSNQSTNNSSQPSQNQQSNTKLQGKTAFIREDNVWVSIDGVEKQLTSDAIPAEIPYITGLPKIFYRDPQISPDGQKIAFLEYSAENIDNGILYVSGIDGKNAKKLADDAAWLIRSVQWSSNSDKVFYTTSTITVQENGVEYKNNIYQVDVNTNKKEKAADYLEKSGCGGGSLDMSDHVAESEGIHGFGRGVQVFQISPSDDYLIHTYSCTGAGFAMLDLKSKVEKNLSENAIIPVISPSGSLIAALTDKIVIFDAKTGNIIKTLNPSEQPTNLLWSPNEEEIYYASENLVKDLNLPDEIAIDIFGESTIKFKVGKSTLNKITLDTGKETKIIDLDAHNLKLINVDQENSRILAATVENATKLYEYVMQNKTKNNLSKYYPVVNLVEINLNTANFQMVLTNAAQSSYLSN